MGAGGEGGSRTAPTGGRRRREAQGGGLDRLWRLKGGPSPRSSPGGRLLRDLGPRALAGSRRPHLPPPSPQPSPSGRGGKPPRPTRFPTLGRVTQGSPVGRTLRNLGPRALAGSRRPHLPPPSPQPSPSGRGENLPALPVSQPSGGLRKGLPWGELCVTLGRGLLQGRADPTSPRPHPNPLPAGEGEDLPAPPVSQPSGGLREGLQRKRAPEGTGAHKGRPYGRERRRAALGGGPQWALAVERGPLTSILSRWERRFKRLHPAAGRRRPRRRCLAGTGAAIGAARGGRW